MLLLSRFRHFHDEIVVFFTLDYYEKTFVFSSNLNYLFVLLFTYSVFNEHILPFLYEKAGGLKWTRTTDLVLIRHAL